MNEMLHPLQVKAMVENTIRNPSNPAHYMNIQPVGALVEVYVVDELIASSERAVWLQEVGKSHYPPRLYIPKTDVKQELFKLDKSTHCPLKGDASYFSFMGKEIAWCYELPFDFANSITGLVSFWPERVRVEIGV